MGGTVMVLARYRKETGWRKGYSGGSKIRR